MHSFSPDLFNEEERFTAPQAPFESRESPSHSMSQNCEGADMRRAAFRTGKTTVKDNHARLGQLRNALPELLLVNAVVKRWLCECVSIFEAVFPWKLAERIRPDDLNSAGAV